LELEELILMKRMKKIAVECCTVSSILAMILGASIVSDESVEAASGGVDVTGKVSGQFSVTVNTTTATLTADPGLSTTSSTAIVVNVKSTANNYNLTAKATNDLTEVSDSTLTLPVARLAWAQSGNSTWTPFTLTDKTLVSAAAKTSGAGTNYSYDYKFSPDAADPAGDYTTTITYTAVQIQ
jgi:hypothetical protein